MKKTVDWYKWVIQNGPMEYKIETRSTEVKFHSIGDFYHYQTWERGWVLTKQTGEWEFEITFLSVYLKLNPEGYSAEMYIHDGKKSTTYKIAVETAIELLEII